jgi:MYXO-CTERM domain-containing protein
MFSWLLALALALAGCGVESAALPALPSSPGLEVMGTDGGVCPSPPPECTGENLGRCCPNADDCSYKRCQFDGQVCRNDVCFMTCNDDTDCAGASPTEDLVCGADKLCVSRRCTSNRGCAAGHVCQGPDGAGVCVPANEIEANPGCSASAAPASSGVLTTAALIVIVAGALARRRRRSE